MTSVASIKPVKTTETTRSKTGCGIAGSRALDGGRDACPPIAFRAVRVMLRTIDNAVRAFPNPKALAVLVERSASLPFEQLSKDVTKQLCANDHGDESRKDKDFNRTQSKYSGQKGIKYV